MREVLISIQAEHNANIESGRKTEELRTRVPKCELPMPTHKIARPFQSWGYVNAAD